MSLYSDFEFEQLKDSLDRFKDICLDDGEDEYETHVAALQLALEALSCEPQATRNLLYKYADAVTDCRLHICPERYIEEGQKILREYEQRRLYDEPAKGNDADIPADNADNRRCPVTSRLDMLREDLGNKGIAIFEDGDGNCLLCKRNTKIFVNYDSDAVDFVPAPPELFTIKEIDWLIDAFTDDVQHKFGDSSLDNDSETLDSNQEG
ncbi:MAG: hypothetical protein J5497_01865 [Selenomonadaceae bacterium]|nr:hypothetical protein [Selenomonadaceae bacterium]